MLKKKEKILVAMSGGVDSSVAAGLLLKKGFSVTGAFMVNYPSSPSGLRHASSENEFTGRSIAEPCWVFDYHDALRVAAKLGIRLIKLDFTKEYNDLVLDYMFGEYEAGRTPNPDVLCNKFVKFGVWLDKARELGFDKLATGHYAKIMKHESCSIKQKSNNKQRGKKNVTCYVLQVPCDKNKDQTYFLHQLNQKQLSRVLFPLGDYTKTEVRALARKWGLPTAEKEESMGICFVGEVPMKDFLRTRIKEKRGNIVLSSGEVIGEHQGLPFYTIGQRHIGSYTLHVTRYKNSQSLYVVAKDFKKNQLVVGHEDDPLLFKKEVIVKDINWIAGREPEYPLKCKVRLRHRQPLQDAIVNTARQHTNTPAFVVKFAKSQRAVTPGQFAVFYKNRECLGGGVISK